MCRGLWLLMNALQMFTYFCISNETKNKPFIFLNRCAESSKSFHISYVLAMYSLTVSFKYESAVSVEIFIIFFTFQPPYNREDLLWLCYFSCFCLNNETLSQWWDSAEILVLWYYWLIMAFSVIICVGTYSNHNAQIIIKSI